MKIAIQPSVDGIVNKKSQNFKPIFCSLLYVARNPHFFLLQEVAEANVIKAARTGNQTFNDVRKKKEKIIILAVALFIFFCGTF